MKAAKWELSRPVLIGGIGFLILTAGGVWWSLQQKAAADQAERRWRMQQMQWRALAASDPAPTAAIVAELERRTDTARRSVQELRKQLGESSRDPVQTAPVPTARADAFFELAQFMEDQAAQARQAGVALADGETLGFSAHRNSGPADEHLELVHQQKEAIQVALAALWRVKPEELLLVKRENPVLKLALSESGGMASARAARADEWLEWPSGRSLSRAGIMDALALRLSWVGHTATLRAWLGELKRSPVPLVVRQIEVEPLTDGGRPAGGRRSLADLFRDESVALPEAEEGQTTIVPLIDENRSVFHVTLEYLDFTPRPAAAAEEEVW